MPLPQPVRVVHIDLQSGEAYDWKLARGYHAIPRKEHSPVPSIASMWLTTYQLEVSDACHAALEAAYFTPWLHW